MISRALEAAIDFIHTISAAFRIYLARLLCADVTILIAILYTTIYTSLLYAIIYSFFESFPLVYIDVYGFSTGSMGIAFLSIFVGISIIVPLYMLQFKYTVEAKIKKHGMGAPEEFMKMALYTSFLAPAGLFIFGTLLPFLIRGTLMAHFISVHGKRKCTLDCKFDRRLDQHYWYLRDDAVLVHLCSIYLPPVRSFNTRCQRTRQKLDGSSGSPILSSSFQRIGRRWRCFASRRVESCVLWRLVVPLAVWC
jgi:hypothetical protein